MPINAPKDPIKAHLGHHVSIKAPKEPIMARLGHHVPIKAIIWLTRALPKEPNKGHRRRRIIDPSMSSYAESRLPVHRLHCVVCFQCTIAVTRIEMPCCLPMGCTSSSSACLLLRRLSLGSCKQGCPDSRLHLFPRTQIFEPAKHTTMHAAKGTKKCLFKTSETPKTFTSNHVNYVKTPLLHIFEDSTRPGQNLTR